MTSTAPNHPVSQKTKTSENLPPKKRHLFLKILASLLLFFFLLVALGSAYVYFIYGDLIEDLYYEALALVHDATKDTFRQHDASIFYDANGEKLFYAHSEKEVFYLEYKDIPQSIKDIIITVEDRRYYQHHGIDYIGLLGLGIDFIANGFEITRGGSTITQQLARNIFLSHEVTLERKFKEMVIARELEKLFSKEEILEFYLNNIYFGNGAYGIESAAQTYFNKSCTALSKNEQIFLLGLPSNPSLYDPFDNMRNTLYRKNLMIDVLLKRNYLGETEAKRLKTEPITLSPAEHVTAQDYLQSYARYAATEAIMRMNDFHFQYQFSSSAASRTYQNAYDEAYQAAALELNTGGYRIYTTLEPARQDRLQQVLDNELAGFTQTNAEGIYTLQGAACVIDNKNGRVVNIIGGRNQETYSYSLNRAFQSYRQPGSTIKPLVDYGPLMDLNDRYGPSTLIGNAPIKDGPRNLDDLYSSSMTMQHALSLSKNVPAWNVMSIVGPKRAMGYLYKMEFRHISPLDEAAMATALGGFTYGTNTLEMASAYSAFNRDGQFISPTCIERITRADGTLVYTPTTETISVYTPRTSQLMTKMLRNVMTSGTGSRVQLTGRPSAGKTGTTNELKDGWFVGYTPQYTTAVWVGYDTPRTIRGLQGGTYPGRIWRNIMTILHEGLPVENFPPTNYGNGGGSIKVTPYTPPGSEKPKSQTPENNQQTETNNESPETPAENTAPSTTEAPSPVEAQPPAETQPAETQPSENNE